MSKDKRRKVIKGPHSKWTVFDAGRVKGPNGMFAIEPSLRIESDLGAVHREYAKLLIKRYQEDSRTDFQTEQDIQKKMIGIIGQRQFQSFLNHWRIPYIHAEFGLQKIMAHRVYVDFIVPDVGTLEIKTSPDPGGFRIKRESWEIGRKYGNLPDYVILLLRHSDIFSTIKGYLKGGDVKEDGERVRVEAGPNSKCKYKPCYYGEYSNLRPWEELESKFKNVSLDPSRCTYSTFKFEDWHASRR